jgi:hypothetical protein
MHTHKLCIALLHTLCADSASVAFLLQSAILCTRQNAASGRPTSLDAALASDGSSDEGSAVFANAVAAHLVSLAPEGLFGAHNLTPAPEGNALALHQHVHTHLGCVVCQLCIADCIV